MDSHSSVAVIVTAAGTPKTAAPHVARTMRSLRAQSRVPDEIVCVYGADLDKARRAGETQVHADRFFHVTAGIELLPDALAQWATQPVVKRQPWHAGLYTDVLPELAQLLPVAQVVVADDYSTIQIRRCL